MVAKVARSIASDADRRNAEKPSYRKIKPVVGIGIRVWWQAVCRVKEISVVACRVRVSLVMDSIIIPIVGVDAAADSLDIVGACQEIAIGGKDDLRVDGAVRVAAEEEVFPCEDAAAVATVKPTTPVKVVKNGVTYKSVGNTAAVIKSDKSQTSVVIPNKVKIGSKNYKVTKINSGVFKNSAKLRSVAIGDNVSSIGSGAFYGCNKLAKVTTRSASKLRTIGSSAFGKCVKLTSITIPKSVTKIGAKAFFKASWLKKVSFKRSVPPTIGKYAFKGIYKKAVFDVPNKSVGKYTKKLKASKSLTSGMTVK